MTRVKICGITNAFDARLAVHAGATAIGLIFARSPRRVTVAAAQDVVVVIPPFVEIVAVFMDAPVGEVRDVCSSLRIHTVQLHGFEGPDYVRELKREFAVVKACSVESTAEIESLADYGADAYLVDSRSPTGAGGTGRTCDWALARAAASQYPVILAGGLSPDNVRRAVTLVRPYAVDASSSLEESQGKKDPQKMRRFVEEVLRGDMDLLAESDEKEQSQ